MDTQWINTTDTEWEKTTDTEWSTLTVSTSGSLLQLNFTQYAATPSVGPFWSLYVDKQTLSFTQHSASPAITYPAGLQTLSFTQHSINIGLSDTVWEDTSDTVWEDTSDTVWETKLVDVSPIVSLLQLNITQYGITPAITYPANLIVLTSTIYSASTEITYIVDLIAQNLILNGDMELDLEHNSDWISTGAVSENRSNEQAQQGNWSWKFTPSGGGGIVSAYYDTISSTTYKCVAYIRPAATELINVTVYSGSDGTTSIYDGGGILTKDVWNKVSFNVMEPSGGSLARIAFWSNGYDQVYVDAVSITAVGQSLIVNGDMELDSNWVSAGSVSVCEQSTEQKHTGNYSWKAITSSSGGIYYISYYPTVTGLTYRAEVYVFSTDTRIKLVVKKGIDGTTDLYNVEHTIIANEWNRISVDVIETAGGSNGSVMVWSSNAATFYVDDVSVIELGQLPSMASSIYSANPLITYITGLQSLNIQQYSSIIHIDSAIEITVSLLSLSFTQYGADPLIVYPSGLQTLSFTQYGINPAIVYTGAGLQTLSFTQYGINPAIVYTGAGLQTLSFTQYGVISGTVFPAGLQTLSFTQYGADPLIVYPSGLQTLSFTQYGVNIETAYTVGLQTLSFTQNGVSTEITYPVSLQTLSFTQYGINPAIIYPAGLQTLSFTQNGINPAIVYPAGLQSLIIQSYPVIGIIGDILTAYVKHLSLSFTQNGINPAIVYPAGLQSLNFTQNSVDTEIAYPVALQTLNFTQFGADGSNIVKTTSLQTLSFTQYGADGSTLAKNTSLQTLNFTQNNVDISISVTYPVGLQTLNITQHADYLRLWSLIYLKKQSLNINIHELDSLYIYSNIDINIQNTLSILLTINQANAYTEDYAPRPGRILLGQGIYDHRGTAMILNKSGNKTVLGQGIYRSRR